jgi:hypothetical protein
MHFGGGRALCAAIRASFSFVLLQTERTMGNLWVLDDLYSVVDRQLWWDLSFPTVI